MLERLLEKANKLQVGAAEGPRGQEATQKLVGPMPEWARKKGLKDHWA